MLSSIKPSTFGQNFLTLYFLAKFPSTTSINNAIIRNKKVKSLSSFNIEIIEKKLIKMPVPVSKCTKYALITLIFRGRFFFTVLK